MVVTGGVLWDGIRLPISEIIDPPWKHGDSISNLFVEAMRPAELILVDQEWPNRIICRQSADPICAGAAMSNSIVRRTVWITAGVWAVLILAVIIQSMLGRHGSRRQAGSQPADNHDDAAVHGGDVRSRHRRGNGHWVVAEPPAGCQRERVKW